MSPTMIGARRNPAFTLIELLIVLVVMGILAAAMLPDSNPAVHDQLQSAGRIVASDIAYARSLAVTNNSHYRITFDIDGNLYVLRHSGTNPDLNPLPPSPFRSPDDPPDEHIVRMEQLPALRADVRLYAAQAVGSTTTSVTDLEFGPLGETTRSEETLVWVSAGQGDARRYISVRVNPVTGLTRVENFQTAPPAVSP